MRPYKPVHDLEKAICQYTKAPYCVVVNSCTIALEMLCTYFKVRNVTIPKRTYTSVPQVIVKSGGVVYFDDRDWIGCYRFDPYPIWDYAPRFTSGMYRAGQCQALSFHRRKILGHTEGGAILTDDPRIEDWLRTARHDGRVPGEYSAQIIGFHATMTPGVAAELLAKLATLPEDNIDMGDPYEDQSL